MVLELGTLIKLDKELGTLIKLDKELDTLINHHTTGTRHINTES